MGATIRDGSAALSGVVGAVGGRPADFLVLRDLAEQIEQDRCVGAQRGTTTLLVTHDTRILDRADRILTLEEGRIVTVDGKG